MTDRASNQRRAAAQRSKTRRGLAALIPVSDDSATSEAASDPQVVDVRQSTKRARARRPDVGPPAASAHKAPEIAAPISIEGLTLIDVNPAEVHPNHAQPRTIFDPDAIEQLAASIKEIGFLQPIVVRPDGDSWELIAGERRLRAARSLDLPKIPALVRSTADEAMLRDALLENLQRVQLNPLEEAAAYEQLLVDFGCTHDELAARLGRSRPQISNTVRLLKLPPAVASRVAAGVLSAGHARALLSVDDSERADELARRVVAEGISVRGLEEIVATAKPKRRVAKPQKATQQPVELEAVAARLSDKYETRVQVAMGRKRGKIVIEFADIDDLHRIVTTMDELPS